MHGKAHGTRRRDKLRPPPPSQGGAVQRAHFSHKKWAISAKNAEMAHFRHLKPPFPSKCTWSCGTSFCRQVFWLMDPGLRSLPSRAPASDIFAAAPHLQRRLRVGLAPNFLFQLQPGVWEEHLQHFREIIPWAGEERKKNFLSLQTGGWRLERGPRGRRRPPFEQKFSFQNFGFML